MTPQERQLVDDLFDRLAGLESNPRDPDAERAIAEGLKRAPNAVYALVQSVLVQDEALRRADARIRELSGEDAQEPQPRGFLDSMREALAGPSRTSVPSVRPAGAGATDPRWNSGGTGVAPPPYAGPAVGATPGTAGAGFGGGSFLGTAAASAAGAIGGALLLSSISSMFGHHGGSAFAAVPPQTSPWDNSATNSDLARDAGVNDIGGTGRQAALDDQQDAGFMDDPNDDAAFGDDFDGDFSGDFGGDDSI